MRDVDVTRCLPVCGVLWHCAGNFWGLLEWTILQLSRVGVVALSQVSSIPASTYWGTENQHDHDIGLNRRPKLIGMTKSCQRSVLCFWNVGDYEIRQLTNWNLRPVVICDIRLVRKVRYDLTLKLHNHQERKLSECEKRLTISVFFAGDPVTLTCSLEADAAADTGRFTLFWMFIFAVDAMQLMLLLK